MLPIKRSVIPYNCRQQALSGNNLPYVGFLFLSAAQAKFDMAAVLTNDTDLVEPVRIVTQELGMPVTLLTPSGKPAASLVTAATSVRHVGPYVGPCQLPNPVTLADGRTIKKPLGW